MKNTIECLTKAFIGESQARNRYTFYASSARKEGYEQIAEVFTITADNENEHAEWFFKYLNTLKAKSGNSFSEVSVEADAPVIWGKTMENLKAAIAGENMEHSKLYPEFAQIAGSEGFPDIAARFRSIAVAEQHHEERFGKLLKELEAGTLFNKKEPVWWFCRKCGYMHFGNQPPEKCPSCDHERSYYQVKSEIY